MFLMQIRTKLNAAFFLKIMSKADYYFSFLRIQQTRINRTFYDFNQSMNAKGTTEINYSLLY